MKKTFLIITALLFITSTAFPQSKVNVNSLKEYGGKVFKGDDDKPYTGKVFGLDKSTGKKSLQGQYKNGLKTGKWTYYTYMVGVGKYEVTYKAGIHTVAVFKDNLGTKYTGAPTSKYNPYGQKPKEGTYLFQEGKIYDFSNFPKVFTTYKDGEKNGLWTRWHGDGHKQHEGVHKDGIEDGKWTGWNMHGQKVWVKTYKDGKKDGLWTEWHSNGQKWEEGTYKNGKKDGLRTEWYWNGQKKLEGTYKDDELISSKCWDEDGNECSICMYYGCK